MRATFFVVVHSLLIAVASLVAEPLEFQGVWALVAAAQWP